MGGKPSCLESARMHTIVGRRAIHGLTSVAIFAIAAVGLAGQAAPPPAKTPPASPKILDARLAQAKAEAARLAGEQKTLLGRLRQIELQMQTREFEREQTARQQAV